MHAAIGSQCKLMNRDVCVRVVFACECGLCGVRVFVRVCDVWCVRVCVARACVCARVCVRVFVWCVVRCMRVCVCMCVWCGVRVCVRVCVVCVCMCVCACVSVTGHAEVA